MKLTKKKLIRLGVLIIGVMLMLIGIVVHGLIFYLGWALMLGVLCSELYF